MQKERYGVESSFFEEGNKVRVTNLRNQTLVEDEFISEQQFRCGVSGCGILVRGIIGYTAHYASCHANACAACGKSFPSQRFLNFHIREIHDPLFVNMAKKQKMYECLVEDCKRLFWSAGKRSAHLREYHQYPAEYAQFFLRSVHKLKTKIPKKDTEIMQSDKSVNTGSIDQTDNMDVALGSLNISEEREVDLSARIPTSFSFGRRANPFSRNIYHYTGHKK